MLECFNSNIRGNCSLNIELLHFFDNQENELCK